jgi:hypothetical protein
VVLVGGKPPKTLAKGHVSSDSSGPVQTSWRLHITYHCHSVKAFFYNIIHTYIYIYYNCRFTYTCIYAKKQSYTYVYVYKMWIYLYAYINMYINSSCLSSWWAAPFVRSQGQLRVPRPPWYHPSRKLSTSEP